MQAGLLDQRLTIQAAGEAGDGQGGMVETWAAITDGERIAGQVVPVYSAEAPIGGEQRLETKYRVTLRNRADLAASQRLVWHDRGDLVLEIRELPDPGPRAAFREVYAVAGAKR
jgi:head-tail adaptor